MTQNENEKINAYIKEYGLDTMPDRTLAMEWWEGYDRGHHTGYDKGHAVGYTEGVDDAYKKGHRDGFNVAAETIREATNGE